MNPPGVPEGIECYDLGGGLYWSSVQHDGEPCGIHLWHRCKNAPGDDYLSAGGVMFEGAPRDVHGPRWTVVNRDPLTLQPSIHCMVCGTHGYIIDGTWRPC